MELLLPRYSLLANLSTNGFAHPFPDYIRFFPLALLVCVCSLHSRALILSLYSSFTPNSISLSLSLSHSLFYFSCSLAFSLFLALPFFWPSDPLSLISRKTMKLASIRWLYEKKNPLSSVYVWFNSLARTHCQVNTERIPNKKKNERKKMIITHSFNHSNFLYWIHTVQRADRSNLS